MAETIRLMDIRDSDISLDEVYESVRDEHAGGIALFVGVVRNHDDDKSVTTLSYSAHPSATARQRDVAESVVASHDLVALSAVHRVGLLAIGDIAVVVAASAAHRADAFAACRAMIDSLKSDVPIWKEQTYRSGDVEWVGA